MLPHEEYKPYLEFYASFWTVKDNSFENAAAEQLTLQKCDTIEIKDFWPSIDDDDRMILEQMNCIANPN